MRPVQRRWDARHLGVPAPGKTLWVEVKRPVGNRQAEAHKAFDRFVTGIGHTYVLAMLDKNLDAVLEKVKVTVQMYRRNPHGPGRCPEVREADIRGLGSAGVAQGRRPTMA